MSQKYNSEYIEELEAFFIARNEIVIGKGYLRSRTQPLFSAYNSATDTNVTGDGTSYTIICNTEIFDIDGNYNNVNGIFTAPVTGKYLLIANTLVIEIGAAHIKGQSNIITSNRTYNGGFLNPYAAADAGFYSFMTTTIADMDAGDTAYSNIIISSGAKTCDVYGAATPFTRFQGYLLI